MLIVISADINVPLDLKVDEPAEENHLEVKKKLPELRKFTICLWIKTQDKIDPSMILTYFSESKDYELVLSNSATGLIVFMKQNPSTW